MFRSIGCWSMVACLALGLVGQSTRAADPLAKDRFQPKDVFELEWASDPQISPDGKQIVYVRNFFDIMKDRARSNLWIINTDGSEHRPLTTGNNNDGSPRWSPDGKKLIYVSSEDGSAQVWCRWMDTGQTAKLTKLTSGPSGITWSPDGKQIAFSMFVPDKRKPYITMPEKPKGAEWAEMPKVIDRVLYRADGRGYTKDGYTHLFVLPAEGGTARQLTEGPYNHGTPSWSPDSQYLLFAAHRSKDWEYEPRERNIYEVAVRDGKLRQLTNQKGPEGDPVVSPDGKQLAFIGYDDRLQGYQLTRLYIANRDGTDPVVVAKGFDRDMGDLNWDKSGKGLYFQFDDQGTTCIGHVSTDGKTRTLARNVGGTSLGRPYASGSYSVADDGVIAFTQTDPQHPADVAVQFPDKGSTQLTRLNDDLLSHKQMGTLEEIWYESSYDHRKIQGWILKPPGFDPKKKYPLILEIHGGPFANYGPRFSAEMQLYAAADYVVFYCNPRGSTSYGEEFGNLIHHNYPSQDYDDLMSGVDAVIKRGYIDENNLFVTGGSGGGVLTAWIIGMTNRFCAAVVCKPVINWFSFVLTADMYPYFTRYWFPGPPWENLEHYMKRSPLSLVGNVKTPTMLITGEADHRTPISESEQYYQALKLRKVDTVLVRIPGASHNIAARPSQLIAKVACILRWFDSHKREK